MKKCAAIPDVRKLFRKALDITGLLADDIDSELISKVLTAEAKKRGGMLADVICIRGDTVNWEDISGELENLAAERQVMTNNVVRRMEEFVDAVIARAAFVLKNPGFFDALETASDVAEYLVRYALCKIGCARFYTEPLIWIEAAATDKDTQALLRGSDEDGVQGRRLLEALAALSVEGKLLHTLRDVGPHALSCGLASEVRFLR